MKRKLKHACCAVRVHTLIMNSFFGGVLFFFFCVSSPQDLTTKRGGGERLCSRYLHFAFVCVSRISANCELQIQRVFYAQLAYLFG